MRPLPLAAAAALLLSPAALADGGCAQGQGCHGSGDDPFDCEAGLTKANIGWSEDQKRWCCQNHLKGCTCQQGGGCGGLGTDPFDCQEGEAEWATGWADVKKEWCCQHFQTGCDAGSDLGAASSSAEVAPTNQKYNCSEGKFLWERGWSEDKKKFCCTAANTGCSPSPSPSHHWLLHKGRSCGDGLGGTAVSDDTNPVKTDMWLQDCMETCIHTDGCEGIVVTRNVNSLGQQGSAPCYLRKDIDPRECREDSEYDLYLYKGQDGGGVGYSSIRGASGSQSFGTCSIGSVFCPGSQAFWRFIVIVIVIVIVLVVGLACLIREGRSRIRAL